VKFTDVQHRRDMRGKKNRSTKLVVTHTGVGVQPSLANSGVLLCWKMGKIAVCKTLYMNLGIGGIWASVNMKYNYIHSILILAW